MHLRTAWRPALSLGCRVARAHREGTAERKGVRSGAVNRAFQSTERGPIPAGTSGRATLLPILPSWGYLVRPHFPAHHEEASHTRARFRESHSASPTFLPFHLHRSNLYSAGGPDVFPFLAIHWLATLFFPNFLFATAYVTEGAFLSSQTRPRDWSHGEKTTTSEPRFRHALTEYLVTTGVLLGTSEWSSRRRCLRCQKSSD